MIIYQQLFPDYQLRATSCAVLCISGGQLTRVVQAAVLSPPLQLLAVVVEALQAHDAVMQTDPGNIR